MRQHRPQWIAVTIALGAIALWSCQGPTGSDAGCTDCTGTDAGSDAGVNGGSDAGAGSDAGSDAGFDAGNPGDAGNDVDGGNPVDGGHGFSWRSISIGGGGYVVGLVLHPTEPDLIYARCDIGGFYRWDPVDAGWIALTDGMKSNTELGGESLATDPNNPDVVYIAVGLGGAGELWRSNDRGATWGKLDLTVVMDGNADRRWGGERLQIDPFNSQVLLFGSRQNGLWRSQDGGLGDWTRVTTLLGEPGIGVTAVSFDPQIPGRVFAAVYDGTGSGDGGVFASTDHGVSWQPIGGSQTPLRLIAEDGGLFVTGETTPEVWRYNTSGSSSDVTPPVSGATPPFGYCGLSVNPTDDQDLIVAWGQADGTKIYRSTNGGTSWSERTGTGDSGTVPWWSDSMFREHTSQVAFDPSHLNPPRAWQSDWYGIRRAEDMGASAPVWTAYERGHEEVVAMALTAPPVGPLLWSGVADVGGFAHDTLDTPPDTRLTYQDNHGFGFSPAAPGTVLRAGWNRFNNTGTVLVSVDGGAWSTSSAWTTGAMPRRIAAAASTPGTFIVTVSADHPQLTADDFGQTWTTITSLPDAPVGPWEHSQPLTADTVIDNTFYYYDFASGNVYRGDGGTFTLTTTLAAKATNALRAVPGSAGELFLGIDKSGLWHSVNGAGSFTQIAGVSDAQLVAFGIADGGIALYIYGSIDAGTGVYRSLDRGQTWRVLSDPNQPLPPLVGVLEGSVQVDGQIYVGTSGRGLFVGQPY